MSRAPNVLLVMVDQLVPFLTGAFGHPVVRTPSLDRLAAAGIRFDAAYTPYRACSPARVALLTGRFASDLGCWDNASILAADEPTVAHYLTNAGYEAVLSGKMHFVGPDQLHGFRRPLTTDVFPAGMDWVPTQDPEGRFVRGGHARSYVPPRVGVTTWTKFLTFDEETHFRALEYLRERARVGSDDPFFSPFRTTTRTIRSSSRRSCGTSTTASRSGSPSGAIRTTPRWTSGRTRRTRRCRRSRRRREPDGAAPSLL